MKVLDLQCPMGHRFEGWFSSENDFAQQLNRGLLECPFCASKDIHKCLSAPRLNLGAHKPAESPSQSPAVQAGDAMPSTLHGGSDAIQALQRAWLEIAKAVVRNTTDVGEHFADEARKMHYGEKPVAAIRGQASAEQVHALWDEGVEVLPLPIPDGLKNDLH
ncbi:DUF1178 family protein [Curvibacter sp. CHRR-16]|uniref:DUF1178 family protein n=1 Tax=Curvibacter sp. CHRR-16 TaxID=2835872 RepID=UPI001BDA6DDA|nr:DUF1178 family protein [Curvibacter sp. CHRR-16]MBT0571458.1 DUF1178 family protein [Curvibacter sp. CHRR-16]